MSQFSPNRPPSVTVVGAVYILAGAIGFVYHLAELTAGGAFRYDALAIELIRLLAILSGAFLLRGSGWARWLALAWMAFHAVLSAFHTPWQFAIHCLFLAATAWLLFRPAASRYFRARALRSSSTADA